MKRIITYTLASLLAVATFAQVETPEREDNIDWKEDSIEIRTINDIIAQQQEATTVNSSEQHFNDVWGRRSYFNISINLPYSLDPKEPIKTGVPYNDGLAPKYKSQLSLTLSRGRSYRLHPNPIANTLQFYIDITPFDFTVSHYKIETKEGAYDSYNMDTTYQEKYGIKTLKTANYTTWNLEKWQADYGILLGPSFTVAPFTSMDNAPGLHFMKFNFYLHAGYRASMLYMVNKEEADANYPKPDPKTKTINQNSPEYKAFDAMKDNAKLDWGHGFYWSWGFSVTWKGIGLGYEHNSGQLKYKSIDTGTFGDSSYKFKTSSNRLYISFRIGK
ncbi:MAG: hypothetical protein IJT75_01840 [Bacteroidaceae bacterium]|nr:hypothetical protein [Bacteroidaceae bacterium]